LPQQTVDLLMEDAKKAANAVLTIDLESQTISRPDGEKVRFEIHPFRKHCLLNGLDDIALTEQKAAAISNYEEKARLSRPWQWNLTRAGA
jgi:3-isopropylmalate/(R)-2-methylmalate dehydratase small subunit